MVEMQYYLSRGPGDSDEESEEDDHLVVKWAERRYRR
jgi:hypothetical protein